MPAEEPSPWVRRWSHLVPGGARVLDLACGGGRHARWFADRGCRVTGVDRDAAALGALEALVPCAELIVADLETGPWPLAGRSFDAVVVANYLWRARLPELLACVAAEGLLVYETFGVGQAGIGRPANPAFLLAPGELLRIVGDWRTIAFEDGFESRADAPAGGRFVQRIVARRTADAAGRPDRVGDVASPR